MNLNNLLDAINAHPDYHKAGMVLAHKGVVRKTSRDGQAVSGLSIKVDYEKLAELIALQKKRQGIVEILVEIDDDKHLKVGDAVMHLVVAGDIRDHVIDVLTDTLNAIKTTITEKKQYFI